jgi:hypothetical protein
VEALLENVFHETFPLELLKTVGLFSSSDEAGSDAKFLLNSGSDPPFTGSVELGENQAIEGHRFLEFASLVQGIPAGGGIDDDEGFVGSGLVLLANGPFDLSKLVHEIVASVESAGGVAEEKIVVPVDRLLVCLIADGGRVGFMCSGYDRKVKALSPTDELLDGSSAEGIGGGHEDGVTLAFKKVSELGGGSGFPGAIDADDEEDGRIAIGAGCQSGGVGGKKIGYLIPSGLDDIFGRDFSAEFFEVIDNF